MKKPTSLKIYPDPETRRMLEELAKAHRRSLSNMVVQAVRWAWEREKGK